MIDPHHGTLCRDCLEYQKKAPSLEPTSTKGCWALLVATFVIALIWWVVSGLVDARTYAGAYYFTSMVVRFGPWIVGALWLVLGPRIFRCNLWGIYLWLFLDHEQKAHVHLYDPSAFRITTSPIQGYEDWSSFFKQGSLIRLRCGGLFRKNKIEGVLGQHWRVNESWDGNTVKFDDYAGNVINMGYAEKCLQFLHRFTHISAILSDFKALGDERDAWGKIVLDVLAQIESDRNTSRSEHAKRIRILIEDRLNATQMVHRMEKLRERFAKEDLSKSVSAV